MLFFGGWIYTSYISFLQSLARVNASVNDCKRSFLAFLQELLKWFLHSFTVLVIEFCLLVTVVLTSHLLLRVSHTLHKRIVGCPLSHISLVDSLHTFACEHSHCRLETRAFHMPKLDELYQMGRKVQGQAVCRAASSSGSDPSLVHIKTNFREWLTTPSAGMAIYSLRYAFEHQPKSHLQSLKAPCQFQGGKWCVLHNYGRILTIQQMYLFGTPLFD